MPEGLGRCAGGHPPVFYVRLIVRNGFISINVASSRILSDLSAFCRRTQFTLDIPFWPEEGVFSLALLDWLDRDGQIYTRISRVQSARLFHEIHIHSVIYTCIQISQVSIDINYLIQDSTFSDLLWGGKCNTSCFYESKLISPQNAVEISFHKFKIISH